MYTNLADGQTFFGKVFFLLTGQQYIYIFIPVSIILQILTTFFPFLEIAINIMLSVWWDFKRIVYFELLPQNTAINFEVYQLNKLSDALKENNQ